MAKDDLKTHVWPWDIPIEQSEPWARLMEIDKQIKILKSNSDAARELYELMEERNRIEESQLKAEMELWRRNRLEELERAKDQAYEDLDSIYED